EGDLFGIPVASKGPNGPAYDKWHAKSVLSLSAEGLPQFLPLCAEQAEANDNPALGEPLIAATQPGDLWLVEPRSTRRPPQLRSTRRSRPPQLRATHRRRPDLTQAGTRRTLLRRRGRPRAQAEPPVTRCLLRAALRRATDHQGPVQHGPAPSTRCAAAPCPDLNLRLAHDRAQARLLRTRGKGVRIAGVRTACPHVGGLGVRTVPPHSGKLAVPPPRCASHPVTRAAARS